ncbi:MAG TPA: hypothetical protein DEV68_02460 [Corynebacterium flavescens]|nr:hypothetical protein [Corynebacterium flavescens]
MTHLTRQHLVLLVPVLALVLTPLIPMNSNGTLFLGFPVIIMWVVVWSIATTLILSWLYRNEAELGDGPGAKEEAIA